MNKRKHYGRKIKHTKNLYRPKKTKAQKVAGTVLLVVLIGAIAFVGFCVAGPLLDYLGKGSTDDPEWTPESSTTTTPQEITDTSDTSTSDTTKKEEETPTVITDYNAAVLPTGALSNSASLAAELSKLKASGYNSALILLKDSSGYFHYKTQIEGAEELIKTDLTLSEIVSAFTSAGIVPIAEISVLMDNEGCRLFTDMSYKCIGDTASWLDYTADPPIRWANPESEATVEYINSIEAELKSAGITEIVYNNIVFPNFQNYDKKYVDGKYFEASRYSALYNVIGNGNIIEVNAADIITSPYGRTAEILTDISKLGGSRIAVYISRSDFTVDNGYPASDKDLIENILSVVSSKTGSLEIIPIVDSSAINKDAAAQALDALGYKDHIIR